ncbi:MAG: VWA domain-containing protein [Thermodesulfobacteriota bacterium]|nr:VWA domain-containing protein [Thermodesulfobacteriota bacterium]
MFNFKDPWILLSALLIPLIIYKNIKIKGTSRILFSFTEIFKDLKGKKTLFFRYILLSLRCVALCLFIMAFAGPRLVKKTNEILTEGINIILCLDTSGSMKAYDFQIEGKRATRLFVVQKVVKEFINGRKNDRIGMVVFGENAYTQCPLTLDYGIVLDFLDRLEIGMAGDSTALGDGLGISLKRLKDVKAKSKVIILLTDGRNNAGIISPDEASEIASNFNVKVYTIGVGTEGEAPFLVNSMFGRQFVYQKVDLDEKTLKGIAKATGGNYFRATDTGALEEIYKKIDRMEKTEIQEKEYIEYTEIYKRFLIPGIFFLLLEIILGNTILRKIP